MKITICIYVYKDRFVFVLLCKDCLYFRPEWSVVVPNEACSFLTIRLMCTTRVRTYVRTTFATDFFLYGVSYIPMCVCIRMHVFRRWLVLRCSTISEAGRWRDVLARNCAEEVRRRHGDSHSHKLHDDNSNNNSTPNLPHRHDDDDNHDNHNAEHDREGEKAQPLDDGSKTALPALAG